ADAGIDASRAGTALNSVLSQFQNPATKFRQELGALGIVTNNFDDALRQLAAKGPAGAKAINAVGLEAGPGLRALLNQGMGALDELTEKLRNAEGSAAAAAKTMQDNFSGSVLGLKSVWQSAVEVLNTPVLPVLRKGVDELTAAIRRGIEDGTIARFGQTLAVGFENALKYFREFAANVNFDAIVLRLQVFASETQETLQRIGSYASNAGHTVQLAWGVMTAGTHAVMAVIYKVGEAFAGVASNIQSGLALLYDGLSKVSFGAISEAYARAAAEVRLSAEATWAASQALADKSSESFSAMATSAQMARDGWDGLTGMVEQTNKALPALGQTVQEVAAQIEASGQAAAKAQAALEAKAESDRKA
ncbi:phage tail tape measure protein, partial [Comamonas jiangduensis]|uniref:phage tail tape measure protein n=1 Tax=Comamonas jiangduensis TaxID=1194168 RepID=UPI003BF87B5C